MPRLSSVYSVFLVAAIAILWGGCQDSSDQSSSQPTLGVSVMTSTNPFFMKLGNAIRDEAAKHGYETILVSGDYDVSKQKNQISDFIVQGVDAIVVAPVDSKGIVTAIKEANEAGIPVFTSDLAVISDDVDIVSHVATDNYQAGRVAGKAMIEALGGSGGNIGILDFAQAESVILRVRGFMDELTEYKEDSGISIDVVSKLPGGASRDISFRAMEDMIQAHPDLVGVFAINDPSALGAVAALEKAGRLEGVKIISVDGQPEGRKAIKEGKVYADAIQHPLLIAEKTVEVLVQYMNGEEVPAEVLIPTNMYKMEDALRDTTLN